MDKKKLLFLALGGFLALLLTGCKCANSAVSVYEVLLDSPNAYELVATLNPSFEWHSSTTCEPDHFRIRIDENVLYGGDWADQDIDGDLSAYTLTGDSLLPGREYAWHMQAWNDYDSEDPDPNHGPYSADSYFYTGPVCSGETLIAPDLQYPREHTNQQQDNWITHNHLQEFKWSYSGGCLPVSYDFQFASDIGFTDIILSGTTTEPYVMHTYQQFPNCSSVFWRVAANDGTTTGPWSDIWQFHWVQDDTCWQNHYISDDAARIRVMLFEDVCDMTGFPASNARIKVGCERWRNSLLVTADGERGVPDHWLSDYRVDLGSGPCPSTGLDHRRLAASSNPDRYLYVLAPGTYCVSITRSQTVENGSVNLMKGIWSEPQTMDLVAYQTVELGPGTTDLTLNFGWDRFEPAVLFYPIPENINCRVGPDPICDPLKIPMAGEILPILGRDMETEWKKTSYEGETCFVYLTNAQINEALSEVPGNQLLTEDLPFYDPQPPCPTPTPVPRGPSPTGCAQYTTERSCVAAKCYWYHVNDTTSICIPY